MTKKFTFIDLFSGIGSFHYSLEKLGGTCLMASDIDKNANEIYKENFGIEPLADICQLKYEQIPDCDILCAGFPCQAFSNIGKGKGMNEKRGILIHEIVRILKNKQIKSFILENVRGLLTHNKGETFKKIIELLEECNYKIKYQILKCSDYGVPQMRKRLFIVGLKNDLFESDIEYHFPEPFPLKMTLSKLLNKKFKKDIAYTIRCGGRGSGIKNRHNWDCYLVDDKEYQLTIEDCKLIQNFPKNFILLGSKTQKFKRLGNTIPTNLTYQVGKSLISLL
jgi:DNA (cytosine-5)-methyltransferase 1